MQRHEKSKKSAFIFYSLFLIIILSLFSCPTIQDNPEVFFNLKIHPDNQKIIIAQYKLTLNSKDNDNWATVLILGLKVASEEAQKGDQIAVAMNFKEDDPTMYITTQKNYKEYINKLIKFEEFLSRLRVIKVSS